MLIYLGELTLHENLFFATREVGRLYETGRYLHNYALTYALGLAVAPYFHAEQKPRYQEQISSLNDRGIYVTPARGATVTYALNTFKYGDNRYHVEMVQGSLNTPSFGRAKEIAVGSAFHFAVLSANEPLSLPKWVRLGLWRSKATVTWETAAADFVSSRTNQATYPLNPLDVQAVLYSFDLISMPPSSLIDQVTTSGDWWVAASDSLGPVWLPAGMAYTFPKGVE